jgi:hypothetical protein
MSQPQYLLVFISILFGLSLAELMQSLHRLVINRERVTWHWLPLAWAGLVFLLIMQLWWSYFELLSAPAWANLFMFLVPTGVLLVVYLISAAVLPDAGGLSRVDLLEVHLAGRRWFFGLGAVLFPLLILQNVMALGGFLWGLNHGLRISATLLMLVLASSRNRLLHSLVTIIAYTMLITFIVRYTMRLE